MVIITNERRATAEGDEHREVKHGPKLRADEQNRYEALPSRASGHKTIQLFKVMLRDEGPNEIGCSRGS